MSVRPSEVCDFSANNVPNINKKSDFYDMNTKYPFHRVKLTGFTQKAYGLYPKRKRESGGTGKKRDMERRNRER